MASVVDLAKILAAVAAAHGSLALTNTVAPNNLRAVVMAAIAIGGLGAAGLAANGLSVASAAAALFALTLAHSGARLVNELMKKEEADVAIWHKTTIGKDLPPGLKPQPSTTTIVLMNTLWFLTAAAGVTIAFPSSIFVPSVLALLSLPAFYAYTRARDADGMAYANKVVAVFKATLADVVAQMAVARARKEAQKKK